MGENSNIEWTDHTFNPWRGCVEVHAGCDHCYARELSKRNPAALGQWGESELGGGVRVAASESYWRTPVKWNREAEAAGVRARVFCASLADVFEEWSGVMLNAKGEALFTDESGDVPITMAHCRQRLFSLIDATPWLDWILVTKRPENIRRMWGMKTDFRPIFPGAPGKLGAATECMVSQARRSNVWLLTSVSDQASADKQIPELLKSRHLVPVLGLSAEPLLGPIDLATDATVCDYCREITLDKNSWMCPCGQPLIQDAYTFAERLDWVIVGGESGHHARPMHPDWARSIRDQCAAAGVPFFFKQWGEFVPAEMAPPMSRPVVVLSDGRLLEGSRVLDDPCDAAAEIMVRVGKKAAGRTLDGREWSEFPGAEAVA